MPGSPLAPKPELSTLKLGGTRFGDDDLAELERFPSLETLDLRETAVTDAGLARLKGLTNLKRLSLEGCKVSNAAVNALTRARPGLSVGRPAKAAAGSFQTSGSESLPESP